MRVDTSIRPIHGKEQLCYWIRPENAKWCSLPGAFEVAGTPYCEEHWIMNFLSHLRKAVRDAGYEAAALT